MEDIDVTRVETEEIRDKFPNLYREQVKHGIIATLTLFSKKSNAQLFERVSGLQLAHGSDSLFKRYLMLKKETETSDFGCLNCLYQSVECKHGEKFSPRRSVVDGKPSCNHYAYYD